MVSVGVVAHVLETRVAFIAYTTPLLLSLAPFGLSYLSFKNVWRFSSRSTSKIFSTPVLRGFDSEFANKVLNLCYLYL